MEKNEFGYQSQANMMKNINERNNNINQNNLSKNNNNDSNINKPFEQPKIGRNMPAPVRVENAPYPVNQTNVDKTFSHSTKMNSSDFDVTLMENKEAEYADFGTELMESKGVKTSNITVEKMKEPKKKKEFRQGRLKSIIMKIVVIGLILEVILIISVTAIRKIKSLNSTKSIICSTSIADEENKATIKTENKYYFRNDKNYKKEVETKYLFNNKEAFEQYKTKYVDSGIYSIAGMTYENSFNSSDFSYTYRINYDINKIKNDSQNKSKDDTKINIVDEKNESLLELQVLSLEKTKKLEESQGYTCIIKK